MQLAAQINKTILKPHYFNEEEFCCCFSSNLEHPLFENNEIIKLKKLFTELERKTNPLLQCNCPYISLLSLINLAFANIIFNITIKTNPLLQRNCPYISLLSLINLAFAHIIFNITIKINTPATMQLSLHLTTVIN